MFARYPGFAANVKKWTDELKAREMEKFGPREYKHLNAQEKKKVDDFVGDKRKRFLMAIKSVLSTIWEDAPEGEKEELMPTEIEDVLRMGRAEVSKEVQRWYSSGIMDNASATMGDIIEEYREFMQPQGKGVWKKRKLVSQADLDGGDDDDVELASAPAMGIKRRREPTLEERRAASKARRLQKEQAGASSSADAGPSAGAVDDLD